MNKYLQVLIGALIGIGCAVKFGNDEGLRIFIAFTLPFFAVSLINNSKYNNGTSPFGVALIIYLIGGAVLIGVLMISDIIEYWPILVSIGAIVGLFYLYALVTNKKS